MGVVFSGQLDLQLEPLLDISESKTVVYLFYKSGCGLHWIAIFTIRAMARHTSESKTIAYMFYEGGCGLLWIAIFTVRAMAMRTSESKTSMRVL